MVADFTELPDDRRGTGSDTFTGQATERLLALVCRTSPPERDEFLREACQLSGVEQCVAALWLYDSDSTQALYLLDRVLMHGCNSEDCTELEHIFCFREDEAGNADNRTGQEIGVERHPRIVDWCQKQGFQPHSTLFPLSIPAKADVTSKTESSDESFLGFLQLLTPRKISDTAGGLLFHLASSLTQAIEKRRETRLLKLSKKLQPTKGSKKREDGNELFQLAAEELREFTNAELCLVYRQQPDLSFRAVAGDAEGDRQLTLDALAVSSASRIQQIANQKLTRVRIREFSDDSERQSIFNTTSYDEEHVAQLRPWLSREMESLAAQAVVVDDHTIAVILIFNKQRHLAKLFSRTDASALSTVATFLSTAIPAASINAALDALSLLDMDDILGKATSPDIYKWLARFIPGVATAGLYHKAQETLEAEYHPLGGEPWFSSPVLPTTIGSKVHELPRTSTESRFRCHFEIPRLEEVTVVLEIGLRRDYLAKHEERLISHLCAEISHVIRAEQAATMGLNDLVQVRHVIGATLNGIGNIQPVLSQYRRVASTSDPSELLTSSFRKGLERTELFYLRTSVLLEEAKFLLQDISPGTLTLDRLSIAKLVAETCTALRCSADYRGITIQFHDRLVSYLRDADVDRNLIQIVLFNLVDNAIKYGYRDRDVIVNVMVEGNDWVTTVTDYGLYIPPEDHERIFQKFVRMPKGAHAAQRLGTGLGLAVAKNIAQAHGGNIEVSSTKQRTHPSVLAETTFTLRIPRRIVRDKD